jgi:hypothetical protein
MKDRCLKWFPPLAERKLDGIFISYLTYILVFLESFFPAPVFIFTCGVVIFVMKLYYTSEDDVRRNVKDKRIRLSSS